MIIKLYILKTISKPFNSTLAREKRTLHFPVMLKTAIMHISKWLPVNTIHSSKMKMEIIWGYLNSQPKYLLSLTPIHMTLMAKRVIFWFCFKWIQLLLQKWRDWWAVPIFNYNLTHYRPSSKVCPEPTITTCHKLSICNGTSTRTTCTYGRRYQ